MEVFDWVFETVFVSVKAGWILELHSLLFSENDRRRLLNSKHEEKFGSTCRSILISRDRKAFCWQDVCSAAFHLPYQLSYSAKKNF